LLPKTKSNFDLSSETSEEEDSDSRAGSSESAKQSVEYSSDASDPSGVVHADEEPDLVQWLLPKSKNARLHLLSDGAIDGSPLPSCRNHPFCSGVTDGTGLRLALDTGRSWCPTCFGRLPDIVKQWWSDAELVQAEYDS